MTHGVRRWSPDTGHDGNDDVLFDSERTRVDLKAKDGDIGQITSPGFTDRESDQ